MWCKQIMQSNVTYRRLARIHTLRWYDYRVMVYVQSAFYTRFPNMLYTQYRCSECMRVSIRVRFANCEMQCLDTVAHHEHSQRTNYMNNVRAHTHSDTQRKRNEKQSEATNMSRSDITCYAILDAFFRPFFTSSFALQYWWHYQAEIKKFRWYTMVIQVVWSVFSTRYKSFSRAVYKVLCCWFFCMCTQLRKHTSWSSVQSILLHIVVAVICNV